MAKNKTKATGQSVRAFIGGLDDEAVRRDCRVLADVMKKATRAEPKMWGTRMVGFGQYHYKYASGHEGDCFLTGFAPAKGKLTLYIMAGLSRFDGLLKKLGKYKSSKSCLYIKTLDDIDLPTLKEMIRLSVAYVKKTYA